LYAFIFLPDEKSGGSFRDPVTATKQLAKLSQEGSCIPIVINISIIEKISAVA
jgi:hypothetical protein